MTREEWKSRAAARFKERGGITDVEAMQLACELFDAQGGSFDSSVDYNPEECADLDIGEMVLGGLKKLAAQEKFGDGKPQHIFHDEFN